MGTRGICGFRFDDKDYLTYNHWDSYPSGLGVAIAEICKLVNWQDTPTPNIILVDGNSTPTNEQIKECSRYHDSSVSTGSKSEWYSLLRNTQGADGIREILLTNLRYMIDNHDFIHDSLFCEWGYIINLDDMCLEIYRGFQNRMPKNSRYKNGPDDSGYYSCELIETIKLDDPDIVQKVKDIER